MIAITEPPKPQRPRYDPRLVLRSTVFLQLYEKTMNRMIGWHDFYSHPTRAAIQQMDAIHRQEIKAAGRLSKTEVAQETARLLELLAETDFERVKETRRQERNRVGQVEKLLDRMVELSGELSGVLDRISVLTNSPSRDWSAEESWVRHHGLNNLADNRGMVRRIYAVYMPRDDRPDSEIPGYLRERAVAV